MTWEHLSERLAKPFSVKSSFKEGVVLYPDHRLEIDEWLTSAAESDQELSELDIARVGFLQNHWRMERLVELEWVNRASVTRRSAWALYVGNRVYFVFSGGFKYWLLAATDQVDQTALYQEVLRELLRNRDFVPTPPSRIRYLRKDLLPSADDRYNLHNDGKREHPSGRTLLHEWADLWVHAIVWGFCHENRAQTLH